MTDIDASTAASELEALSAQLDQVQNVSSSEYTSWLYRTRSALTRYLGTVHPITEAFIRIGWNPSVYPADGRDYRRAFDEGIQEAQGLLDAAGYELMKIGTPEDFANAVGFDPELWGHVAGHVSAAEWGKVASQTAIFTEDRIRKWAGRPVAEVGEKLMTSVFGDRGDFRLGLTDGEKQGWHRLAMGVAMALRNADAHRIQTREDLQRYAMGVLGASSLLLTQLRYEHSKRFHDVSPAEAGKQRIALGEAE